MTLFLLRHGQTDWNAAKRFQSRSDIPLNDTGREQARRIRRRLETIGTSFFRVKTSPLGRAIETANIVTVNTGLTPEIDESLLEISLGDFEGMHEATLEENIGDEFNRWRSLHFTEAAPNGETIYEAIDRVQPLLSALVSSGTDQNVLLVGHQGINMAIMSALSKRQDLESLADFRQRNDQIEVWDCVQGERIERFDV